MAHAILSASGAKRWLSCPPSALLEQRFPDNTTDYAKEGTLAHALAELRLRCYLGNIKPAQFKKSLKEIQEDPLYSPAMDDYINGYVDHVIERHNEIPGAVMMLEQRLDFSEWVPEGFGTGDVILISQDGIEIIDLKYGKGVPVSAIENPQLRLYGLGCISTFGMLYDFTKVRMTIIQPRLDNISTEEMPEDELVGWAEEYVRPRAQLAINGEGALCAGDHCQFCKVSGQCRARVERNLELARYDFQDPFLLSDEEIADILGRADELKKWVTDITEYALDQAESHGVKFPGWKLVEDRSNRIYSDQEAVESKLLAGDYIDIYKPRELLGITAMEKLLGKKEFELWLGDLVIKPVGKPTLVPESDKRPEINSIKSAQEDFQIEE